MLEKLRQDVVGFTLWLAFSSVALGQSFTQGQTLYQRGDFAGAQKAISQTLKTETSAEGKAMTLKLLGICQYMLGDKKAAGESFQKALKLKPGLQIAANEVLDDSVIAYFKGFAGTKKGTFLKVQANVKGSVLIDGIIAGATGDSISTEPGAVEVEIQAQGYVTQKLKMTVTKDKETVLTANLQKPKPKASPPGGHPKAQPKVPPPALVQDKKKKSKVPEDLLFEEPARDPAAEFEQETQMGYAPPQGVPAGAQLAYTQTGQPVYLIVQQPAYAQPYAPPPPPTPPGSTYGEADPYAPPPAIDPAAPVQDPAERAAKAGPSPNSLLITLLPFGAGQFQNCSYLLGSAFFASEAYLVYYYVSTSPQLAKDTRARNRFVADKNSKGEEFSADDKAYVDKADKSIKANKQNLMYAQASFGALWAVGVVQALVAERDPPAKDKKTRKQRKYGGFSYVVPDDVDLGPVLAQDFPGLRTDFSLNLRWEF